MSDPGRSALGPSNAVIGQEMGDALSQWKWCDCESHGYVTVEVTPQRPRIMAASAEKSDVPGVG